MDAAFAHSRQHVQSWDHFKAVFGAVWAQSQGVSAWFPDRRRNMDPPPETKEESKQWTSPGERERAPKMAKLSYRSESLWPPFSGMHKMRSTSTTWRRAKRSRCSTMPNYWADSTPNFRKNGPIQRRKNVLPLWQRTGSHLRRRHCQICRLSTYWSALVVTVFLQSIFDWFPVCVRKQHQVHLDIDGNLHIYVINFHSHEFNEKLNKILTNAPWICPDLANRAESRVTFRIFNFPRGHFPRPVVFNQFQSINYHIKTGIRWKMHRRLKSDLRYPSTSSIRSNWNLL